MRSFPKHMKRRAMSHNIKRIPKRLRELHAVLREKSNTREGPSKVPRRKYRRRPKELLNEYNRRQREHIWLETHIWHAKRFKMVNKWGYRVPLSPNDKSYRACYRATANHCLLQDISYYNCIELAGAEETLLSSLTRHTSAETGLTFAAQATISGSREGSLMFYKAGKYPFGAVGEVSFIWKPIINDSTTRSLWLWSHPGFFEELLQELISTFNLTNVQTEESMDVSEEVTKEVEMKKIQLRNVPYSRTPKYTNNCGISLIILKDTLNRFRLTGPLSQAVLSQSLTPIFLDKRAKKEGSDWVNDYYFGECKNAKVACDAQQNVWSLIKQYYSPAQLAPRLVLPLTIIDPRFNMPSSRRKAVHTSSTNELKPFERPLEANQLDSPLWSYSVRDTVTKMKPSTEQINRMRSEKLVPGLEVESVEENQTEDVPCLPVILIQRPGSQESSKRLGYGSGWDVISPCGYAMPLWLSFVLSGARTGGLREAEAFYREFSYHPIHQQPDTTTGKTEEKKNRLEATEIFFRLPPAKRRNYIKLNIPTPFHCPWSVLSKDWDGLEEFYVMRNKKILGLLESCLKQRTLDCVNSMNEIDVAKGALIPVRIDLKGKGKLDRNSHICLLHETDLKCVPKESPRKDEHHQERLNLRTEHQKLLKHLARKRHKAKVAEREEQALPSDSSKDFKQVVLENSSIKWIDEHSEKMRSLWLPSCDTIKDTCSRTVIGFVSNGDYCFTEGISSGIGYVILNGLKEYLKSRTFNENIVLIRCTHTDQYRLAKLNVIV
ncbi:POP1 ribonuclease P/MRP subunit isoform X2 [Rhodnius prolixus]